MRLNCAEKELEYVKTRKQLCIILFCCITGISWSQEVDSNHTANETDIKEAVAGNTDFALALYDKLRGDLPRGNLFFSPYSISTALAVTYAGARGDTQKQMAETLHFTLPDKRLHNTFGFLQEQLVQENKSRGYVLFLANALWGQKGEPFLKEFLDLNKNYYGAGCSKLDFVNETEKSR